MDRNVKVSNTGVLLSFERPALSAGERPDLAGCTSSRTLLYAAVREKPSDEHERLP
jgi:hypothetical protein